MGTAREILPMGKVVLGLYVLRIVYLHWSLDSGCHSSRSSKRCTSSTYWRRSTCIFLPTRRISTLGILASWSWRRRWLGQLTSKRDQAMQQAIANTKVHSM